jgi:uncharacterized RDD family membrane protein YckC
MQTASVQSAQAEVIARHTQVLWPRFLAFFFDGLILSVLINMFINVFGISDETYNTGSATFQIGNTGTSPMSQAIHIGNVSFGLSVSASFLVMILYFTVQEGFLGTTLGKAIARLHVIQESGARLTWGRAIMRNLLLPVDMLLFVGLFSARFSRWHQRLGDRVARTLVMGNESLAVPLYSYRQRTIGVIVCLSVLAATMIGAGIFNYVGRPQVMIQNLLYSQSAPSANCVSSYSVGSPTRNGSDVTYPITYAINGGESPSQHGLITLHWNGILAGWHIANAIGATCRGATP